MKLPHQRRITILIKSFSLRNLNFYQVKVFMDKEQIVVVALFFDGENLSAALPMHPQK
jgi:hypothetical protein